MISRTDDMVYGASLSRSNSLESNESHIGRVHAPARARSRTRVADDVEALFLGDLANLERPPRLETLTDVAFIASFVAHRRTVDVSGARLDRPTVDCVRDVRTAWELQSSR